LIDIILSFVALLIAIIGHEIFHAIAAYKCGDNTPVDRITINPIKHIDPVGSIIIPLALFVLDSPFLFGWAKPVPVNISTVIRNRGYGGAVTVSLAGVFYNFLVAFITAFILTNIEFDKSFLDSIIITLLYNIIIYNVMLGFFNLLPIPPLDGANALGYTALAFGNRSIANFFNKIDRFGMIILFVILMTPLSKVIFYPVKLIINWLI